LNGYLLDTNICIYFLKGLFDLNRKIHEVSISRCFISEITLAELKFGAENSEHKVRNRDTVNRFAQHFAIFPILNSLDTYAREKTRLRQIGQPLDDFDLLIGSTAITHGLTLVTRNTSHFNRMAGIQLENWADASR
jgi:tRNA(fMet)-specific endonuclease VapC